jgi:hypothetical protein
MHSFIRQDLDLIYIILIFRVKYIYQSIRNYKISVCFGFVVITADSVHSVAFVVITADCIHSVAFVASFVEAINVVFRSKSHSICGGYFLPIFRRRLSRVYPTVRVYFTLKLHGIIICD